MPSHVFVDRLCGGSYGNIPTFWDAMARDPVHPAYADHPFHTHPRFNHRTHGIPIRLHGDGVESIACGKQWPRTVEGISWSPALAKHVQSHHIYYLIVVVFKECIVKGKTMEDIWSKTLWSFYWAYMGVHPKRGHTGRTYVPADGILYTQRKTPLAGGYFLAAWLTGADLEWCLDFFNMGNYRSGKEPCSLCRCDDKHDSRPWTDCRRFIATWLPTL